MSHFYKNHTVRGAGGIKLYVEETGNPNGRPLLFIHGFMQNRFVWEKQVNSDLAEDFRLVTLDNRGHGFSEKPRDAYGDARLWADDIEAVIDALQLVSPVLIGWSYGGIIIFDYIRHYGEGKIGGINLVGARTRIGVPESIEETGEVYPMIKPHLLSNDVNENISAVEKFIQLCTYQELSAKEYYFFLGFNSVVPPYVRQGLMSRSVTNHDILSTLEKPFLITHGIEDPIVLLRHAKYNASLIKNVESSFYEEVAHSPFWENADRFNRELRAFTNRLNLG